MTGGWTEEETKSCARLAMMAIIGVFFHLTSRGGDPLIVLLAGSIDGAARSARSGVWVVSPGAPHIQRPYRAQNVYPVVKSCSQAEPHRSHLVSSGVVVTETVVDGSFALAFNILLQEALSSVP